MNAELIAHSKTGGALREQPLLEHLENVARLAAERASHFGSAQAAEWLGWWHDAGKVAADVQAYLRDPNSTPPGPDHSSAGMLYALEKGLEPFGFNIAGHHGGLPDRTKLREREKEKRTQSAQQRVLDALTLARKVLKDVAPVFDPFSIPSFLLSGSEGERKRRLELWIRMLHSALVDADCLDTEVHFNPQRATARASSFPSINELWARFEEQQQKMLAEVPVSSVNRIRAEIYQHCMDAALLPPGIFSLTVPTGGGKTRSALGFALCHAHKYGLRRVIITLPYTTIIEQNADEYRKILGEGVVLEHHSAARSTEQEASEDWDEQRQRMAAENWDVPVVVTTSVQFFESLFANRNSRVRKLHNIARSVVVLDEVQTLPPKLLAPTLEVLRQLCEDYGVTLLLCTATQPAFGKRERFPGFPSITEILPDPTTVYQQLKRVDYRLEQYEKWSWKRVADELRAVSQGMVVLNTVKDALRLLDEFRNEPDILHLSANMCGKHRREVLHKVRQRLKAAEPVRLVATQVVEAGVDLDFPRVMRAFGPLDSIIQAAGRCNREGKLERGEVIVFDPEEGGMPPDAYRRGADQTRALLAGMNGEVLHDSSLPTKYFERLYGISDLDRETVQAHRMTFSFVETAQAYRLIDDEQTPVLVQYGEDAARDKTIEKIQATGIISRYDWRVLQPYLVNLRQKRLKEAIDAGVLFEIAKDLYLLDAPYYNAGRGVTVNSPAVGNLII